MHLDICVSDKKLEESLEASYLWNINFSNLILKAVLTYVLFKNYGMGQRRLIQV